MLAMTADFHAAEDPASAFHTRLLRSAELRLALPLVRLLYPAVTEREWVDYATQSQGGEERRILVACNPGGYVHGLCILQGNLDLHCGRTLDVEELVVASFLDYKSVMRALLSGVEQMAREGACQAVRVMLADSNLPHRQGVADALNSIGYVRNTARFAKPLAKAPQPISTS